MLIPQNDNGGSLARSIAGDIASLVPQAEKLTGKGHSMYYAEAAEANNIAELAEIRDELAEIVHTARSTQREGWLSVAAEIGWPILLIVGGVGVIWAAWT